MRLHLAAAGGGAAPFALGFGNLTQRAWQLNGSTMLKRPRPAECHTLSILGGKAGDMEKHVHRRLQLDRLLALGTMKQEYPQKAFGSWPVRGLARPRRIANARQHHSRCSSRAYICSHLGYLHESAKISHISPEEKAPRTSRGLF